MNKTALIDDTLLVQVFVLSWRNAESSQTLLLGNIVQIVLLSRLTASSAIKTTGLSLSLEYSLLFSTMVWKINKHRRSGDKRDSIKQAQKAVLENQPKLKSCLKTTKYLSEHAQPSQDFSPFQNDDFIGKGVRDQSIKSGGSKSRSAKSVGSNRFSDRSVESIGSGNSSSVHSKRIAPVEQHSVSSRSWDRESRKSETAQSTQTTSSGHSLASTSRSLSEVKKKTVRFNVIYFRDYERMIGDNPSCTCGPPVR